MIIDKYLLTTGIHAELLRNRYAKSHRAARVLYPDSHMVSDYWTEGTPIHTGGGEMMFREITAQLGARRHHASLVS